MLTYRKAYFRQFCRWAYRMRKPSEAATWCYRVYRHYRRQGVRPKF